MSIIGNPVILGQSGGGASASIVLTVTHGATNVTCTTPNGLVLSVAGVIGTDTDVYTFNNLTVYGNYVCSATFSGTAKTKNCEIDSAEQYELRFIGLPAEYTEKKFIQSTGTQRIVISYKPKSTDIIEIDCELTTVGCTQCFWCARSGLTSYTYTCFSIFSNNSDSFRLDNGISANSQVYGGSVSSRKKYLIHNGNGTFKVNGTTIGTYQQSSFTAGGNLSLFASYNPDTSSGWGNYSYEKFYGLSIVAQDLSNKVDLIPCVRNSDSAGGVYDIVNNAFYGNSGTGTFIVG